MANPPKSSLFFCFFLLLAGLTLSEGFYRHGLAADDVQISVSLSQKQLRVNQSAALTITVSGTQSAEIELPEVENLLFQRRGQSRKIEMINGNFSSSIATSFHVRPLREGKYVIPPITVMIGGEVVQTEPISLTAIPENPGKPGSSERSADNSTNRGLAFLKIVNLPEKGYRGQLIPVTIKAYFREGIRAEIDHLPAISGASYVLTPLTREPLQSKEFVEGIPYSVLTWKSSLSAIKAGNHPLQFVLDATLLIPARNRSNRGLDPFLNDDVFRGFFDRIERKDVNLPSKAHMLHISSLPERGKPVTFDGAIGNFNFEVTASPRAVEIGEPVTLTMSISGEGNFDTVTPPVFPNTDAWKTYSPVSSFDDLGEGFRGTKTFEQAIVPTSGEVEAIPKIFFSYFNPDQGGYITVTSDPLPLRVKGMASPQTPISSPQLADTSGSSPDNKQPPPTVDQHLTSSGFTQAITPVFQQLWFIVLTILTTLGLIAIVVAQGRKKYLLLNQTLLQGKALEKMLAEKDRTLQIALEGGEDDLFLRTCREMIQIRVAQGQNRESSTLTLADLRNILPADSPLVELFSATQEQVYGGRQLTKPEMVRYRQQLHAAIKESL